VGRQASGCGGGGGGGWLAGGEGALSGSTVPYHNRQCHVTTLRVRRQHRTPSPLPCPSSAQHFISEGYLFPLARPFYWFGLRTNSTADPRNFTWIDPTLDVEFVAAWDPGSSYTHWGNDNGQQEPNNQPSPPEMCIGAGLGLALPAEPAAGAAAGTSTPGTSAGFWGAPISCPPGPPPPGPPAGANFSMEFDGAAAWADSNCALKYPIMCKLARG
jgi:hypothetical protein